MESMSPADRTSDGATDRRRGRLLPRLLVALLTLDAAGILAIWAASLRAGAFSDGLFAYQLEGAVPFFHLAAEVGMAAAVLVGVAGWLAAARWSLPVLTFAAGMLTYGAVTSLGWALHNDVALAVPMALTVALAGWLLVARIRAGGPGR
jgi:hypothetical protein